MKKVTTFLSILLLAIVSCTKEDISPPVPAAAIPQELIIVPKKMVYYNDQDNNIITIFLTYNGNKIVETTLTENALTFKEVYTYAGDVIVKIESFEGTTREGISEFLYENNKLKTCLTSRNSEDAQGLAYVKKNQTSLYLQCKWNSFRKKL